MKNFLNITKWIMGQIRPFILSFIWIILSGALLSACSVVFAVASKWLIDAVTAGNLSGAANTAVIFSVIIVINIAVRRMVLILSGKTLELLSNSLRHRIFSNILHSGWMDISKYHSGDIVTRMTRDIGILSNVLVNVIPGMFSLGVQLIGAFTVLMFFEPALAVAALILGPAGILLSRLFGRKLKKIHKKLQETEGVYRSFIHESLQNLLVVKSFCLEQRNIGLIDSIQDERLDWVLQKDRASSAANAALQTGYWLGYLISFGFGAYLISKGSATFGTFTAFIQLVGQVQGPFEGLAYKLPQLISAAASAERLMELDMLGAEEESKSIPICAHMGIEFENVSFRYDSNKPVLNNVSFSFFPGEITAIAGPSGEGKTTIIRLILSLIYPECGNIFFFSEEKKEKLECCPSCRKLVSYVPQGNTLFSGTIKENLSLGNTEVNELDMIKALKGASAWEFIEELPEGMDTLIGERGIGLSEGQAQRIAIARALLKKAPALIFDEATSALDADTEMNVLKAVMKLENHPTCILVTHRVSVMNMCNRVLKLDNGKIIEYNNIPISNSTCEAI